MNPGSHECGSNGQSPDNRCRQMHDAVESEWFPVSFDEMMSEYQLELVNPPGAAILQFCPWCGGELPGSQRGNYFKEMSDEELQDVRARMAPLNRLDEVESALGAPDVAGERGGPEDDPWIRWHRYECVWDSLILTVGEHNDGRISWAASGRYIGPYRE